MSHFTTIKTKMNDLDILKRSLDELGYNWVEARHEAGIKLVLCKHLELLPSMEGDYTISGDMYYAAGEMARLNSADFANQLQQKYSCLKVKEELSHRGYTVLSETADRRGEIKLTVRKL